MDKGNTDFEGIIFFTFLVIGLATSFFNDKNRNVAKDLVELLNDTRQEVPTWLESLACESHQGSGRNRSRRLETCLGVFYDNSSNIEWFSNDCWK